jgi:cellulose synthase/poly-beta-1,6-N-acetylglucosamine synthase-like glycosyltransferase
VRDNPRTVTALAVVFWTSIALIVYVHAGYPLVLMAAAGASRERHHAAPAETPSVSLIIAAHNEGAVIAAKVANARALEWPSDRLQVIVCADGCSDDTVARARDAGADLVLDLPRGGKTRTQDAGAAAARGELLAFSDANSIWERGALAALAGAFDDPAVGYACGQVRFVQAGEGPGADNQEGLYWRYEMAIRARESRLASVTAGNGAIYAVRAAEYLVIDEVMDHDLYYPFSFVKRGRRAVYVPAARAGEKMVPSIDGEFARKRRMWGHVWPMVLRGGMLAPRGYGLRYAWMMLSHRLLRYFAPALHLAAFATNVALLGHGAIYVALLIAQLAVLAAALAASWLRWRILALARYYVLMHAALVAALWDYLRHGTPPGWETPEGTR